MPLPGVKKKRAEASKAKVEIEKLMNTHAGALNDEKRRTLEGRPSNWRDVAILKDTWEEQGNMRKKLKELDSDIKAGDESTKKSKKKKDFMGKINKMLKDSKTKN